MWARSHRTSLVSAGPHPPPVRQSAVAWSAARSPVAEPIGSPAGRDDVPMDGDLAAWPGIAPKSRAVQDVAVDRSPRTRSAAGLVALVALAVLAFFSVWTCCRRRRRRPTRRPTSSAPDGRSSTSNASARRCTWPAARRRPTCATTSSRRCERTGSSRRSRTRSARTRTDGDNFAMAHVHNVVAVLPGTASTGRVFAVAHYDSVQVSYGGNDDGAGVATLLETARGADAGPAAAQRHRVRASPTPRRRACAAPRRSSARTRWRPTAGWC